MNELVNLGFEVEIGFKEVRIKENDSKLQDVLRIAANHEYNGLIEHYYTIVPTALDLIQSSSLILIPKSLVDYIPFDNLKYLEECFDTSNACPQDPSNPANFPWKGCGLGYVQVRPFRIRTSKLHKKNLDIFVLDEHADALFVSTDLYDQVFSKIGMDYWPVIDYKSGESSTRYVQLRITDTVELDTSELTPTVCDICKRTKYKPLMGWYAPRPLSIDRPMSLSVQKFGIEGEAISLIIVNSAFYGKLREYGLKHNIFWPCADEGVRYPDI
ncbi:hypothetical protein KDL29_10335 [bacterium]|nr:hypothetical protein [bacterium]